MDIMQGLQVLTKNLSTQGQTILGGLSGMLGADVNPNAERTGRQPALSGMLGPAAIGGLLGALLTSGTARSITGGALLAGGGAALWNKYKNRITEANAANPDFAETSTAHPDERVTRLIRAMVFAAKSDGHIDDDEQKNIQAQLDKLDLGPQAQDIVSQAMSEPLDPNLIAQGVNGADEALEIFTLSCAIINPDHFLERAYLEALAKALGIPDDVKDDLLKNLH